MHLCYSKCPKGVQRAQRTIEGIRDCVVCVSGDQATVIDGHGGTRISSQRSDIGDLTVFPDGRIDLGEVGKRINEAILTSSDNHIAIIDPSRLAAVAWAVKYSQVRKDTVVPYPRMVDVAILKAIRVKGIGSSRVTLHDRGASRINAHLQARNKAGRPAERAHVDELVPMMLVSVVRRWAVLRCRPNWHD